MKELREKTTKEAKKNNLYPGSKSCSENKINSRGKGQTRCALMSVLHQHSFCYVHNKRVCGLTVALIEDVFGRFPQV